MNSLTAFLNEYQKHTARFHMPGHKGNCLFLEALGGKRDITEITGADSLYTASGCIAEVEKQFSSYYGEQSVLSAGGSTLCIQTILSLCANKKILAARNSHVAFMNAAALCGIQPEWIPAKLNTSTELIRPPQATEIQELLEKIPSIEAVYITSPDFYGQMADITSIASVCRKKNSLLIVDNAHGGYLHCLSPSLHPLHLGADLCCDSLHKTLPALTGAALLHIKKGLFSTMEVKSKMSLFGSTSPSYLIMESAGKAIDYLQEHGHADWKALIDKRKQMVQALLKNGFSLLDTEPSKLTIDLTTLKITPEALRHSLQQNAIEAEYIDKRYVVFMLSPFNYEKDLDLLQDFLLKIPIRPSLPTSSCSKPFHPQISCTLREAIFAPAESVAVAYAEGRISAQNLFTCPPGIPIVLAGEQIVKKIIEMLKKSGISSIYVLK